MNSANLRHRAEGFPGQRIVVLPRRVVAAALAQPLLRGLLPTDIGYFPKASGHFMSRATGADQAIFIYCVKGLGWCEITGNRQLIHSGELLVVPPGTPHAYGADEDRPWTIFWVHLKGESIPALLAELGITPARPILLLGEDPELLALFEEVLDVIEHGYALFRLLYASQILAHLIGLMIWDRHRTGRDNPDAAQKVAQSIAYMKQHLDQPAAAASFAALANLSESHYRSLFKRQTGYAPVDYFIRLRMHKACQLLDTTRLSVKEIATAVGYQDPLYFSRAFKAVIELAPSEYRLVHKG
ncbi:MAG: AraC family transcriptional regulator [Verrucomicrobiota bacterium]|nr:AraC family transcriptional regulator [Verrucomicrobiota bacterium]